MTENKPKQSNLQHTDQPNKAPARKKGGCENSTINVIYKQTKTHNYQTKYA